MMPLWLAIGICTLAWSSGAFFGAGMSGKGASAFAIANRPAPNRAEQARREQVERRHKAALRLASFLGLAVVVWLTASLVLAEASPTPWLLLASPDAVQ